MNNDDDITDKTPHDTAEDGPGTRGRRRLRFWLRAAEGLIARERAYGRRGVRERIEAAIPAEDLDITVRTLEAIARELGDEHEVRAFGSRGRGRGFGRGGFGPGIGPRFGPGFRPGFAPGFGPGFGADDADGGGLHGRLRPGGFGPGPFGVHGREPGGFGPDHPHAHAGRHGFDPRGAGHRGRHHGC